MFQGASAELCTEVGVCSPEVPLECLYTTDTMHRALPGHFDKHFGAGRKKWYRRSDTHPLFPMDIYGKAYREDVLNGTADPTKLPKDSRGSLAAFKTKQWVASHALPT